MPEDDSQRFYQRDTEEKDIKWLIPELQMPPWIIAFLTFINRFLPR